MSNEKFRRETSGFDITFVYDEESGKYKLEKNLPAHLSSQFFRGQICTLKRSYKSYTDYAYCVIDDVFVRYENNPVKGNTYDPAIFFQLTFIFQARPDESKTILDVYYYPNMEVEDKWDKRTVIYAKSVDKSIFSCSFGYTNLLSSVDQETGNVTYTGETYVETPNAGSVGVGIIGTPICLSYGKKHDYTDDDVYTTVVAAYNKVLGGRWGDGTSLKLGSYWRYSPDKVINPTVDIDYNEDLPADTSTPNLGMHRRLVRISFTVKAADVISV